VDDSPVSPISHAVHFLAWSDHSQTLGRSTLAIARLCYMLGARGGVSGISMDYHSRHSEVVQTLWARYLGPSR